eukprot:COSAG06_NODE_216_length_20108_cov_9.428857_17_plen_1409_part_00
MPAPREVPASKPERPAQYSRLPDDTASEPLGTVDRDDSTAAEAAHQSAEQAAADQPDQPEALAAPAVSRLSHLELDPCKVLRGGCWFTHDATTLVHGGVYDTELSLWDLETGQRRVGLTRSKGIVTSALAPLGAVVGSVVCVAGLDGLAMYTMPGSGDDHVEDKCELVWQSDDAIAYCDVAFSRDGSLVASVQSKSGLVQLHDAATGEVRAEVDNFPACWKRGKEHFTQGIGFSEEELIIGGRKGKWNAKLIRVVKIASMLNGETQEHEDVNLRCVFSQLVLDGKGASLAVVTEAPGRLQLWHKRDEPGGRTRWYWDNPTLFGFGRGCKLLDFEQRWATSVAFSNDGRTICTGMHPASVFALWDVDSWQCWRVITAPGSEGRVCAFSPAGDVLATGGEQMEITLHELRPQEMLGAFDMNLGGRGALKVEPGTVCSTTDYVVMASGSCLVVKRSSDNGDTVLSEDLGDRISGGFFPVAISPLATQVACAHNGTTPHTVSLVGIPSGSVEHKLTVDGDDWFGGVNYSPDGASVLVFGNWGTKIFSSTTGEETHWFSFKTFASHHSSTIDPSGQMLLTTGHSGCAAVFDLQSRQQTHRLDDCRAEHRRTYGGCFDDAGERLAYCMRGENHFSEGDDELNAIVVICDAKPPHREINRFLLDGPPYRNLQFSPGDGKYILYVTSIDGRVQMFVLDSQTGEETEWSASLLGLMMPYRVERASGIRWMRPSAEHAQDKERHDGLVLQVVAGNQVCLIDVDRFVYCFRHDGNFTVQQLSQLSCSNGHAIGRLIDQWPHLINVRDSETKDTVLHLCARDDEDKDGSMVAAWLSGETRYTPMENKDGVTALREAVEHKHGEQCKEFIARLDPQLPPQHTRCVTQDLLLIARVFPQRIVAYVESLEHVDGYNLFRPVRDITVLKKRPDGFVVRGSAWDWGAPFAEYELAVTWLKRPQDAQLVAGGKIFRSPHLITEEDEDENASVLCDCVVEVLALRGFAAGPADRQLSPFGQLYNVCQGNGEKSVKALLETRLMIVSTQYKWNAFVRGRMLRAAFLYLLHFMLAVSTFVSTTHITSQRSSSAGSEESGDSTQTLMLNALHAALLISNTRCLWHEVRQMTLARRYEVVDYFSLGSADTIWNVLDLGGIAAVYVACGMHFQSDGAIFVQRAGSLAILLNSFSLLQVLRPFEGPGVLIKVTTAIVHQLRYFMLIITVLLTGFSSAFAVAMPDNLAFDDSGGFDGAVLTSGLLTSYLAMLGAFDIADYTNPESVAFFALFLFLILVIMLNLLIALMSDTFERVMESWVFESRKMRIETIIEEELLLGDSQNAEYFPEYLQVLRPVEEARSDEWAGVSGQISTSREEVKHEVARVEQKVDAVERKVEAVAVEMQANQSAVAAEMKANQALIMEQLRKMASNGA